MTTREMVCCLVSKSSRCQLWERGTISIDVEEKTARSWWRRLLAEFQGLVWETKKCWLVGGDWQLGHTDASNHFILKIHNEIL